MLGLSVYEGIWEFLCNVLNLLFSNSLPIAGVLLALGLPWIITSKTDILQKLKKHIVNVILCILLLSLFLPFLCLYYGAFKKGAILNNSDILGYYGAVIGGVVTVLGVYWTLNYESKKSKEEREYERQKVEEERERERDNLNEERRKDSLPILIFIFLPNNSTLEEMKRNNKYKEDDIVIDTTEESEIYDENFIHEYGSLKIFNVGLGAAIISDVKLIRSKPKNVVVNNSSEKKFKRFILAKYNYRELSMTIRSKDLNKDDTLHLIFTDLYSNEYSYKISFNNINDRYNKTRLVSTDIDIIPTLVSTK